MRSTTPLALTLVASLSTFGCSFDGSSSGPDLEEETPAPTETAPEPTPSPLAGQYELVTALDLGQGILLDADLRALIEGLQSDPVAALVLAGTEQFGLQGPVLDKLEAWLSSKLSPDFSDKAKHIADALDEALGEVEFVSHLTVATDSATAEHTVAGLTLMVDSNSYYVDVAGIAKPASTDLTLANAALELSKHEVVIPIGVALVDVLDGQVAKKIDPDAADLVSALESLADCSDVADAAGDLIDGLDGTLAEVVCELGVQRLSKELEKAVDRLADAKIKASVAGAADLADSDSDGVFDAFKGHWTLNNAGEMPFSGVRM